jgi:hypothetical protein
MNPQVKQPQRKTSNVVRLAADIQPQSFSDDARTVEMQFYTGATVDRYDYNTGEKYKLRLGLDAGQCDIGRLRGAPLLDSHMDWSVRYVLGTCSNPRIDGGVAFATASFADDPESDSIFRKVKSGTLSKVSVGAVILHLSKESEEEGISTYVADKWYPREVSIVPIPADENAGFLSDQLPIAQLMDQQTFDQPQPTPRQEASQMADNLNPQPTGDETRTANLAAVSAAREEGAKAERERVAGIQAAIKAAKLKQEFGDGLIASGATLADARASIIEELGRQSEATEIDNRHTASVQNDQRDRQREGLQNAIEHRCNMNAVKLDAGKPYAGMSLLRIAEESLRLSGVKYSGATPMELAAMALGLRVERFANPGYGGTTDLPLILANVMNKSLRAAYDAYPQTWKPIARGTTLSDFKTKYVNQISEMATPTVVGPGGEFKYVKMSDKRESYALATYGNIIALNRQAIINDDLSAFSRIPTLQGRAVAQLESDIVWALITSNPTMGADSVALFHTATHGNLAGSGGVISQTTLGAMRAAMRVQKNVLAVEYLNIEARYIAVPAAIETVALQQTSNQYTPQQGSNINTFKNLSVIVEPRLDANSAIAWYGFADPAQIDIIEYGYLAGQEGIYTEQRVGFDVDGVEMKVRTDFGAQILDWRGAYKNPGA